MTNDDASFSTILEILAIVERFRQASNAGADPIIEDYLAQVRDKLRGERLLGRIVAASCIKLPEIAKHLGVWHLVNLRGCPLR